MDPFLLEAIVNGILLGGVFALPVLGLNLIFGVVDVVWLCYAELVMVGMYCVWFLHTQAGWPLIAAFAAAVMRPTRRAGGRQVQTFNDR